MMGTEIFKIDAPWAEKLTKTRVSFLMNPSVGIEGAKIVYEFIASRVLGIGMGPLFSAFQANI